MIPPSGTEEWISGLSDTPEGVKEWLITVFNAANQRLLTVGGTVKLVIINSEFETPSELLVEQVQTAIDPTQNAGEGDGLAPIGHFVTVVGVQSEAVNFSFNLTYQSGWSWEDVKPYVTKTLKAYFLELTKSWADQSEPLIVRISQIESRLLTIEGIVDITETTINGQPSNYTLPLDVIPVLGDMIAPLMNQ